jgi:tRNA pseudouridine55 synthase
MKSLFCIKKPDIFLIDKPKNTSSFEAIQIFKGKIKARKVGHAGTLDPLATGLLIVGVDNGTKKLKDLVGLPKTYEVEILVGQKTTTGDLEGEVVESVSVCNLEISKVEKVLQSMVGILKLSVPLYSAIKVQGKPLYKYARSGEKVIVPVREMKIRVIELLDMFLDDDKYVLFVRMDVDSGVYVRSIVEEIGRRLGYPATVKELRRTKVGEFDVKDAEKI